MRYPVLLISALMLSSCITKVDNATVSIRDDGRADIDMVAGPTIDNLPLDSVSDAERERADRDMIEMRECLGGNFIYNPSNLTARMSVRDLTSQQIAVKIQCIDGLSEFADFEIVREEGWFRDRLVAKLDLWFELQKNGDDDLILLNPDYLTFQFSDEVEGKLDYASPAVSVIFDQISADVVSVQFGLDTVGGRQMIARREALESCGGKKPSCPREEPYYANAKFELISYQNNYSLNDILTFFSILFGSGLAITLGSRVLAVRTKRADDDS